jgi:hypothetical protein
VGDVTEADLTGRRLWSLFVISHTPEVAESIVAGKPVLARSLDVTALRRAYRGQPLPKPNDYITVTDEMLDAVDEAGPLTPRAPRQGR